jgi:predicted Rossmann fold flavoprotein
VSHHSHHEDPFKKLMGVPSPENDYYAPWDFVRQANSQAQTFQALHPLHSMTRHSLLLHVLFMAMLSVRWVTSLSSSSSSTKRIAVIGGGASGIFSAVSAVEHYASLKKKPKLEVVVLEATSKTLSKVAISGGGRCNGESRKKHAWFILDSMPRSKQSHTSNHHNLVLHDTSKPTAEILNGYPRGKKELTGLLSSHFTPQQAQEWFQKHGVQLKTEPDGRMFPITDSSQTVIDALLQAAKSVEIRMRQKVLEVNVNPNDCFQVSTQTKDSNNEKSIQQEQFDAIILATGSAPAGYQLAQSILEQAVDKPQPKALVSPVPSLFTMNTKLDIQEEGSLLHGLAGVSVPHARVSFQPVEPAQSTTEESSSPPKRKRSKIPAHLQQEGPLLVTHHGVSGPAVLRLSAFGARDFHECNYRGKLKIHWAPSLGTVEEIAAQLWKCTATNPKRNVATGCPLTVTNLVKDSAGFADKTLAAIPKRLWSSFVVNGCGMEPTTTWAQVNKKAVRALATLVAECELQVTGKGTFKEEFVTAGGVALKEIEMKTMMSKSCPGLFFCGEVINVDGVTGGFNFMNCWGTGHVAGTSAVEYILTKDEEEDSGEEIRTIPNQSAKKAVS